MILKRVLKIRECSINISAFCFFLILIPAIQGNNQTGYYISVTGNDSNPGTKAKPFKTIEKLNKLRLEPGSEVYLEGGSSFTGPLILNSDENGTKESLIVITSYGKGSAIINGDLKEAVIIKGNFFKLSNITVKGAGRKEGNITNGILIQSVEGAIIDNIIVEGFQKSGLELNNCKNAQIMNVLARNNGSCGINISGIKSKSKNIVIKDCKAENNPGDPTNLRNHSGNGILVGGSDSVLIDHCTATNNGWDMPRKGNGPVGIWAYQSDHLIIQYCISYNNKTQVGASDGGGFDLDGGMTNSIIQFCLSYDNQGAGYGLFQYQGASKWVNNTVRYCISINDGRKTKGVGGFFIWNGSGDSTGLSNCKVYNNLVYNDAVSPVMFEGSSKNMKFLFANNIFIGKGDVVSGPSSGEIFIGNVWWNVTGSVIKFRGYNNLADWANSTGQEKLNGEIKGLQIDPSLKGPLTTNLTDPYKLKSLNGYTLQKKSQVIDRGINLQVLYNIIIPPVDFFGNSTLKGKAPEPGINELK